MLDGPESRVDWPSAELLALGTLALKRPEDETEPTDSRRGLNKGHYFVRLTGQDAVRGTFDQRHATLHDSSNGTM